MSSTTDGQSATTKPVVEAAATFPTDPGREIMVELVKFTIAQLKTQDSDKLTPAFLEFTRKLLNDSAITIAHVKRGEFGEVYKRAAEEFPFPNEETRQ